VTVPAEEGSRERPPLARPFVVVRAGQPISTIGSVMTGIGVAVWADVHTALEAVPALAIGPFLVDPVGSPAAGLRSVPTARHDCSPATDRSPGCRARSSAAAPTERLPCCC
jgi:hypothetical protein